MLLPLGHQDEKGKSKKSSFQSLISKNDDVFLYKRCLVLKPVRHYFLGVWFQPGKSFKYFWPVRAEMHLCAGIGGGSHNLNDRISISRPGFLFWSDEAALDELREKIHNEILPDLRKIRAFSDLKFFKLMRETGEKISGHAAYWYLQIAVADGNLELAKQIIDESISKMELNAWQKADVKFSEWLEDMHRIVPLIRSNDIAGIAALLHANEARSVEKAGLQKYWQPTPFPLEEKYL